jgi:preprotein translocase subunit YajC
MEWVVVVVVVLAVGLFFVIARRNRELAQQHQQADPGDSIGDTSDGP